MYMGIWLQPSLKLSFLYIGMTAYLMHFMHICEEGGIYTLVRVG